MSIILRVMLILFALCTFWYVARKIKKSQLQITDVVFWIVTAGIILVMSLFPAAVTFGAKLLGIDSPANLVFLVIIFLLLIRTFLLSVSVSALQHKLKALVEEIAVRETCKNNGLNQNNTLYK